MTLDRRAFLIAGPVALPAIGAAGSALAQDPVGVAAAGAGIDAAAFGVVADANGAQTARLQTAIDAAAARRVPLVLPPGAIETGSLKLRSGSRMVGSGPATVLKRAGTDALIEATEAPGILLGDLTLDAGATGDAPLLALAGCDRLAIMRLATRGGAGHAIALERCGGTVRDCHITKAGATGIFSIDATGLEIAGNLIEDCANNGIQVWRTTVGFDGTIIANNRISGIRAVAGGSGENGNAINIFRAGNVIVSANTIQDCAYSAVRSNAGSDCQIIGNNCTRLGEVAIYAEFEFEGAIISGNLIDDAATGISITNFNDGGRLAVCTGNIVRNLHFRDHADRRGNGIGVEADTVVSGNVVENAPGTGITLGWGPHLRNVIASNNVVRDCAYGIAVSVAEGAGSAVISANLIATPRQSAIQGFEWDAPVGDDLIDGSASAWPQLAISANLKS